MLNTSTPSLRVVQGTEDPLLTEKMFNTFTSVWPTFILHDPVGAQHWVELYLHFPEFQCALLDEASGDLLAICNAIPFHLEGGLDQLPGEGWQWAIKKGLADHERGRAPNAMSALAVTVPHAARGRKLGGKALAAMKRVGLAHRLQYFVAPVRPWLKARYPLTPMTRYIRWQNAEGLPFDPWIRVHARAGARILCPCEQSMRIHGTVKNWTEWTGMHFPECGRYIVPDALVPVEIDLERDEGLYVEPNVWMIHPMHS